MPASICGAIAVRPVAFACTVSLVLPPCASNVTVVCARSCGLPFLSSATAVNTSRSGGTTSSKIPDIGKSMSKAVCAGPRITIQSLPPGCTSSSQTGLVNTRGPHHCAMCLGSVQHCQTNSRGASNTRVRVISLVP